MKRSIGIILIIIVALNLLTIIVRLTNGDSIGAPMYLVILSLMLVFGIVLVSKKPIKSKSNQTTNNVQNESTIFNDENSKTYEDSYKLEESKNIQLLKELEIQEADLQKLRLNDLITDEELESKKELVASKKESILQVIQNIKLEQKIADIKSIVKEAIKPQITLLERSHKSGLFSKEEYDYKCKNLFDENFDLIVSLLCQTPNTKLRLGIVNESELPLFHENDIRLSLPRFSIGQFVIFCKKENKLRQYSFHEILKLNNSMNLSDHLFVIIPNFLDRIGCPQLEKKLAVENLSDRI